MLLLIRTSKFSILNIEVGSLTDVFQHHLDHVVLVPFPHTFVVVEECEGVGVVVVEVI